MKRKIYLELGITLIVGVLIGFFANSIITDKRIKEFTMHKGERMFWQNTLTEINATKEQQAEIMPIVKTYSEQTREILHASWAKIPAIWDQMEAEIEKHLTEEQKIQLRSIQEERKTKMQQSSNRNSQERRSSERRQHGDDDEKKPKPDNDKKRRENRPPAPEEDER